MEKIKVLCFIGMMNSGGTESVMMNYYKRFDKDKFEIIFVTCKDSTDIPYDWLSENNIKLIAMDNFKNIYELFKLFQNSKPILHLNFANFIISIVAFLCGVKVRVLHYHLNNKKISLKHRANRFLTKKFSNIKFACGQLTGESAFGKEDFVYIKNAIDLSKFKFNEYKKDNLLADLDLNDKVVFGCIARFEEQKNHKFLLEIFKVITQKIANSHLILIGDGTLRTDIKDQVKALDLEHSITFTGNIINVWDYYNVFDCFVMTSLFEGFPVVLLEAQTNGLKCFISDTISSEVKMLDSLELLPLEESAEFWAEKIINSYNNGEFKRDKNAVKKVQECGFDIDIEYKKLENLFLNLNQKDNRCDDTLVERK